jgi:hypothetical protein
MAKRDLHGSYSTYVNKKCRCVKCKMSRRDYMRAYRARKKEEARAALEATLAIENSNTETGR